MSRPVLMGTLGGRLVDITNVQPEDLDITEIAHSLSMQCRFAGQVHQYYSVAQHCVLVSQIVEHKYPGNLDLARWGLLHDAAESLLGDLPSPIKKLFPKFSELEDDILAVVADAFDLSPRYVPKAVLQVDSRIGRTERGVLQGKRPLKQVIIPMSHREAEFAFLRRYEEVFNV